MNLPGAAVLGYVLVDDGIKDIAKQLAYQEPQYLGMCLLRIASRILSNN